MQIVDCGCLLALACKSLKNHWLAEQWEANMADREHYIFLQRGAPIFEKKNHYKTSMSKIIFSKPHLSNPVIRALHAQKTRDRRASFMQVGRSSMGLGSFNSFAEAGGAVVLGPKMNFSFWQFFRSWEATRIEKGARFHELQEKSTGWLHADLCYIMSGWRLAKTMLKHKRGAGEPKCNKHDSEIRKLGRFRGGTIFHVFCHAASTEAVQLHLGAGTFLHVTEALHSWNDWIASNIYIPADCSIFWSVRPASCTKGRRQPHPTEEDVAFFKLADVDRQTWIGTD